MGFGNIFQLARLKIQAFQKIERTSDSEIGPGFVVPYNPETLSSNFETHYVGKRSAGAASASSANYSLTRSQEMSLKLVFDGTDVSSFGIEKLRGIPTVKQLVAEFLLYCHYIDSETHEPPYLRLTWGECPLFDGGFDCRLQSCSIQYTLFDRDGSPLRAELTVKFVEAIAPATTAAKLRLASPDLTHRRVVVAGDTLPALCRKIYGSSVHYMRVARVNDLDDFRNLTPGQELFFPPFARGERR